MQARVLASTVMNKSNNEDFICDFLRSGAGMNAVLSEEQIAAFYRDGLYSRVHLALQLLKLWLCSTL